MIVLFKPRAEAELASALDHYFEISDDLGFSFQHEVERALAVITEHPEAFQVVEGSMRRIGLHRFPHGLYYKLALSHLLVVLAVIHPRQHPRTWKSGS